MALYGALARGQMGLTAAVSGVITAALPVLVSWVQEGHAGNLKLTGFALAAVAIWLIAYAPAPVWQAQQRGLGWFWLALSAGLCFGGMLVLMRASAAQSIVWTLTLIRITSTTIAGLLCVAITMRRPQQAANAHIAWKALVPLAVCAGIFDTTGNLLYTLSALAGRLDVAAVVSSLYPAATILLAAILLKEHARRSQWIGMGLAVAAVALIAA